MNSDDQTSNAELLDETSAVTPGSIRPHLGREKPFLKSFLAFFVSQSLSFVGDGLQGIAIPLLVFHLTGSAFSIGLTIALEELPRASFALLGGTFADRFSRKRLMMAADAIRAIVILAFVVFVVVGHLSVVVVYIGVFVISACAAIFRSAQTATMKELVSTENVTKGVGALNVVERLTTFTLPAVGGFLFGRFGAIVPLVATGIAYLLSQIALVRLPEGAREPRPQMALRDLVTDLRFSWNFIHTRSAIAIVAYSILTFNVFSTFSSTAFIPLMKEIFHAGDAIVGVALSIMVIGSILGAASSSVGPEWSVWTCALVAYAISGVALVSATCLHNVEYTIGAFAAVSFVAVFQSVRIISWLLQSIPNDSVGRVFGLIRFIAYIGSVPAALIAGLVAQRYEPRVSVLAAGVGFLSAGIAFGLATVRFNAWKLPDSPSDS